MVIKSLPSGEELKLKDVATVELGSRTYTYIGEVNGHPGSNCMIAQTSGSNANEIIEEIDKVVEDIRETLPKGMEIADLMSTKDYLDASIKNVIKTLFEAINPCNPCSLCVFAEFPFHVHTGHFNHCFFGWYLCIPCRSGI